jgi:sugar lactone lactonase YvrE
MPSNKKVLALLGTAFISLGVGALTAATPTEVTIHDDKPFPESLTSTSDGSLIIGSLGKGEIFKAAKGAATAELWIKPGANGLQRVLGVLADQKTGTLWVCSSELPPQGKLAALKTFDLRTGAPKASFDFPGDKSFCNDIAIGPDGTAYATDTFTGRILRLKKGAAALDVWVKDDQLGGADGIAFGDSNTIYVNTFTTGRLYRVPVGKDGAAGAIAQIQPSQAITRPDGLRPLGKNEFLMIEGAGRLDHVTIDGNTAKIEVLKDGFNGPVAVTRVGDTAWVLEGKLDYLNDPKLKDKDPGPFKAYAVPINGKH